ncbi:effector-binding domain-containing protein [Roseibium hamelinense]|uniref:Effector-binding domain-containing protein n=1 Tax=Roseibium hamelinense TaxID=150831 RepID=A0A562T9I9_9HYPH|nr:GyrI-like domain-containing protein [Roseibium hamelinense]MTI42795.1 AraC family transcriptional regulator [Roseibium hamelinense]TWI89460.1 effector-binding domain-containing protein [Roseibium hamelinense]
MPDFQIVETDDIPYLFEERTAPMDPQAIGAEMGKAFGNVLGFMQQHRIQGAGKVMAVYYTAPTDEITFQAGFSVEKDPGTEASSAIQFAQIPAGKAVYFQHKGSYSKLRDAYGAMLAFMEKESLTMGAPCWEVYLNDPAEVPEEALLTDVYMALA